MGDLWCAGQRVAIYSSHGRQVGKLISEIPYKSIWKVRMNDKGPIWYLLVHRKQLRRIRPKRKAREWIMVMNKNGVVTRASLVGDGAVEWCLVPDTLVHVREVLP